MNLILKMDKILNIFFFNLRPGTGDNYIYIRIVDESQSHFLPGHCLSLSVRGTYITPNSLFLLTVPSDDLSTWSRDWSPPCGPTGIIILPPGASWSMRSCGIVGAAAPTWMALYGPSDEYP